MKTRWIGIGAVVIALGVWVLWPAGGRDSIGTTRATKVEDPRSSAHRDGVRAGGVLPAEVDPANLPPPEVVAPGVDAETMRTLASEDAMDLEAELDKGHGQWLELAVAFRDPRPKLDGHGGFVCSRFLAESCALEVRLVIAADGTVLFASGRTDDASRTTCDAYAACMARHYAGRRFPHGGPEPLAVTLPRQTGKPRDPFFDDPVNLRGLITTLEDDLAAAREVAEFGTPSFQLRYRLQQAAVEAYGTLAQQLEAQ